MRQYLIADSGGTKTDWCFIDVCKTKTYFTTKSYHPSNCDDEFVQTEINFWNNHKYMMEAELHFYGAGCFNVNGHELLKETLKNIGFKNIIVSSDLHGAGLALFGESNGVVAILGTGSVLFDWQNQEVINVIGGKGHLVGDEGSGFYFGKLVYEAFKNNSLTEEQEHVFRSVASIDQIESAIEKRNQKFPLGELSQKLQDYRLLYKEYHESNAKLFCQVHLIENNPIEISVLGSYGYYHRDILRPIFENCGVTISQFLRRPIDVLAEQRVVLID